MKDLNMFSIILIEQVVKALSGEGEVCKYRNVSSKNEPGNGGSCEGVL